MIEFSLSNTTLIIFIPEKLDANSTLEAEKEIFEIISSNTHDEIVLDLQNTKYISSSGLRVFLKIKKTNPNIRLINASHEVYDIFEMTGFTEIMNISKVYREVSVDNCKIIGHGANGTVYRLDSETVIKVYTDENCLSDIKREQTLARRAFILGIPTAIPYDIVKVGKLYGSVFELINAKSFAELLSEKPDNFDFCLHESIALLKTIHATKISTDDVPSIKQDYANRLENLKEYLPSDVYEKLFNLIKNVPDSNNLIHGDFHLKNIMFREGETLLIDMDTLRRGNPIFEFGAIYVSYVGFSECDHNNVKDFLGLDYEVARDFCEKTLQYYTDTSDSEEVEVLKNKAILISSIRIMDHAIRHKLLSEPHGKLVFETCMQHVIELVDKIDKLEI